MSMEVWLGLGEILTEYEADDTLSVVVLSGAGDKAFVSGADISRFAKHRNSADSQKEYDRITGIGREKLHSFPNPIIVKIRGFAWAAGWRSPWPPIFASAHPTASSASRPLTRSIAENAPLSVRASKLAIAQMLKDESQRDMEAIKAISDTCVNSADFKEGRTAFMEKRWPVFIAR
jgi:enoyl-CoA hydratase/carnithine racemase